MGRLINTDELKSAICEYVHRNGDASCKNQTSSCLYSGIRVCDFVNIVNSVPTALDVDEIINKLANISELDGRATYDNPLFEPREIVELDKVVEILERAE